jgi:hypothetical protein
MVYSDQRNNLQQAETSLGLGRGRGSQQQHRLQVLQTAGEVEKKLTYL